MCDLYYMISNELQIMPIKSLNNLPITVVHNLHELVVEFNYLENRRQQSYCIKLPKNRVYTKIYCAIILMIGSHVPPE